MVAKDHLNEGGNGCKPRDVHTLSLAMLKGNDH